MDSPDTVTSLLTAAGWLVWLIFALMCILLPFSAYAAQKWAYRCHTELRRLNKQIGEMNSQLHALSSRDDR